MASNFLKLPRSAQRAAFAHMGDRHSHGKSGHDEGRISGFIGELPDQQDAGRGEFSGKLRGRPRALGSGARHQRLAAGRKNEIGGPARKDPAQQRIDDLHAAYTKGHTDGEPLSGGMSGDLVRKVRLSNGQEAVLKRQNPSEARREYLAGRVANAVGIEDVTVAQLSDREVLMNFVHGDAGAAQLDKAANRFNDYDKTMAAIQSEKKRQVRLRNGREIAMLDWLTDNTDRHALNWIVSPDGKSVIPIDHGRARFEPKKFRGKQHVAPNSPFIDEWIRPQTEPADRRDPHGEQLFVSADPEWTSAEIADIRSKLDALRPEFGRGEDLWFEGMMARLDLLEQK